MEARPEPQGRVYGVFGKGTQPGRTLARAARSGRRQPLAASEGRGDQVADEDSG
jgi:hypothetical protein